MIQSLVPCNHSLVIGNSSDVLNLEIGTKVLGDVRRVTLAEDHDLLLDVFDLILGFFEINNFNSNNLNHVISDSYSPICLFHLLGSVIDSLEDLPEGSLANPLLLGEHYLGIHFLN